MGDSSDFFSQAGNFVSASSGGIDMRTGMFNYSMKLGRIIGNNGLGPSFPVTLSYNPLTSLNGPLPDGIGTGMSLGLTLYDASSNPGRLTLFTGDQYVIADEQLSQSVRKVMTFNRIPSQGDGFRYKVAYKSGRVEILAGDDAPTDLKYVEQIINHLGYALTLKWSLGSGNTQWQNPRLVQISDAQTTLLQIDYPDDDHTSFVFLPGQTETYQVQLTLDNNQLLQVCNPSLGTGTAQVWTLEYDTVGDGTWGQWLVQATSPGGLTEIVNYSADDLHGAVFPGGASLPSLPRAASFLRNPAAGGAMLTASYEYFDYNFLGVGLDNGQWDANSDYVLGYFDSDYQYGTTETRTFTDSVTKQTKQRTTTRTYNCYHLLAQEQVEQDGSSVTTVIDYYAKDATDFDSQPPQYQKPQSITKTWSNGISQRSETVQLQFDEYENITKRVEPSPASGRKGTQTVWDYYPSDGSDEGCPEDPDGFVRFVKSVTTTPGDSDYADTPVQVKQYEYAAFPGGPAAQS
jgi:hypothetical protein